MDYKSVKAKTVDEYFAALTARERKALNAVRRTIKEAAPEAEEYIGYGMPGFRYNGSLVYIAAFKDHLTFFAGGAINQRFARELGAFEQTKGGIHFTPEKPLPASVVKKIVRARMRENEARAKARAKRRK